MEGANLAQDGCIEYAFFHSTDGSYEVNSLSVLLSNQPQPSTDDATMADAESTPSEEQDQSIAIEPGFDNYGLQKQGSSTIIIRIDHDTHIFEGLEWWNVVRQGAFSNSTRD